MTLTKFNPSFPFLADSLFNENNFAGKHVFGNLPAVNILENADDFRIEVAAPGLKKEDFKITLHQQKLTVSVSEQKTEQENTGNYTRKEFSFKSFQRQFGLPNTANTDSIEANYTDGILRLHILKKEEAKPKPEREIAIA